MSKILSFSFYHLHMKCIGDYGDLYLYFSRVKVRVGEYDASGFNPPEARSHIEYTVSKIVRHPQFDAKRLSDDIAVMITSRVIDLQHPYVSPACFPSCQQQFDYVFSNGTGARCWTAGWGKDEFSGSFQFIQHKVGSTYRICKE